MHKKMSFALVAALTLSTACQKNIETKKEETLENTQIKEIQNTKNKKIKPKMQDIENTVQKMDPKVFNPNNFLEQNTLDTKPIVNYATRIPFKDNGPSLKNCVKALEASLITAYEGEKNEEAWVVIAEELIHIEQREAYRFSLGQGTLKTTKIYFQAAVSVDWRIYTEGPNEKWMFFGEIVDKN